MCVPSALAGQGAVTWLKGFRFNLREPAGSLGDFGTLLPLAIGLLAAFWVILFPVSLRNIRRKWIV